MLKGWSEMSDNLNNHDGFDKDSLFGQDTNRIGRSSSFFENNEVSDDRAERSEANSYTYTSENASKPQKKRQLMPLKCIAGILALIIVGTGTVQVVKFLRATQDELVEYSGGTPKKTVDDKESNKVSKILDSTPSLIELASRSDAKPLPDIVDDIMPSVVGIASTFEFERQQTFSMWGWNTQPEVRQFRGTGTGFIISDDGYIVTNAHVIYDEEYPAGEAVDVSVMFSDESEHEADVIAYDLDTDIAVLKVNETGLKPAVLGDSDELRVGELVIAVGNPLGFDLFGTVTSGIVSALNRRIDINDKNMNLIQTDAAINSGNLGGPLLNSCGQVIGINSAKMSSSYSNNMASVEGLCFAIPMKEAKTIIDDLINYKYVTGRPQIGINTDDITEAKSKYWNIPVGVLIMAVQDGSSADLAGLEVGDVIIDIEGEAVSTAKELNEEVNKFKAGDVITLTVSRNGKDIRIKVTLQEKKYISESRRNSLKGDPKAE